MSFLFMHAIKRRLTNKLPAYLTATLKQNFNALTTPKQKTSEQKKIRKAV